MLSFRQTPFAGLLLLTSITSGLAGFLLANYHWARAIENLLPLGQTRWRVKSTWGTVAGRENVSPVGWRHRNLSLLSGLLLAASVGVWVLIYWYLSALRLTSA